MKTPAQDYRQEGEAAADDKSERKKAYKSIVYPAFTLKRCIGNASNIEAKYGTARLERKVAAELLGYTVSKKGLHGTATKAFTAMSAFGLVESAGRGSIRITPQAKRVLYPASKDEKSSELRSAAFRPPLFATIRDRFDGAELVPQEGVVAFLMQEDYEPRYVRVAAKSYIDTVHYLQAETGSTAPPSRHDQGATTTKSVEAKAGASNANGEVSLVLQAEREGFPSITIQLPNNGKIVGSRELGNLIDVLQAYRPVLEGAESVGEEDNA